MADSEESSYSENESYFDEEPSTIDTAITGLYCNEPEYTEEELQSLVTATTDETLDSSRLENLHWCTCSGCGIYEAMKLEEAKTVL